MMTQVEVREAFYHKKQLENSVLPSSTVDIFDTQDFSFSPICPDHRMGDSGPLLLAQHKTNTACQLLVKHARLHSAANEYVYAKLAQAMGYPIPAAVLFQIARTERSLFETDFVVGSSYLKNAKTKPTFKQIREQAANWQDYFRLRALFRIFLDNDGFEAILAENHRVYRIDTADSFEINEFHILSAADIPFMYFTTRQHFIENRLSNDLRPLWDSRYFDAELDCCMQLDATGRACYLEPFDRIQSVPQTFIDDFLNVLCQFYPTLLGDYYKRFIATLQVVAAEYLKTKG